MSIRIDFCSLCAKNTSLQCHCELYTVRQCSSIYRTAVPFHAPTGNLSRLAFRVRKIPGQARNDIRGGCLCYPNIPYGSAVHYTVRQYPPINPASPLHLGLGVAGETMGV